MVRQHTVEVLSGREPSLGRAATQRRLARSIVGKGALLISKLLSRGLEFLGLPLVPDRCIVGQLCGFFDGTWIIWPNRWNLIAPIQSGFFSRGTDFSDQSQDQTRTGNCE